MRLQGGQVFSLIWKDLKSEFSSKEIIISMVAFGISITLLFAFSFNASVHLIKQFSPGLLWLVILFTAILELNKLFAYENNNHAYLIWLSSPIERTDFYFSKVISGFIFLCISEFLIIIPFFIFLNLSLEFSKFHLFVILIAGNLSIISLGSLISGITFRSEMKDVLIPIIFFPLSSPILISATKATNLIFNNNDFVKWEIWLYILLTFSITSLVLGYILSDKIMED